MTKLLSFTLLAVIALFSSCRQMELHPQAENTPTNAASTAPKINFSSDQERLNYTEKNLGTLGKAVAALSADAQFKTLLYTEIEARFDGDDNALFEVVSNKCRAGGLDVAVRAKSFFTANAIKEDFEAAQKAFKASQADFEFDLFPQIHIPFYEDLKAKGFLNKKPPVIVIFAGNEELTERTGSALVNGKLTTLKEPINEAYAKSNEVWVISINESVRDGVIPKPQPKTTPNGRWAYTPTDCDDNNPTRFDQYNIPRPPANAIDVKIGYMTVKCHKDNWLSGADDVEVLMTTGWCNQYDIVTYANQQGDPNPFFWYKSNTSVMERTSKFISKFRREEINNKTPKYVNFSLMRHDVTYAYNNIWGLETVTWPVYWSSGLDPNHPTYSQGYRDYFRDPRRNCLYFSVYEYDNTGARDVSVTSEIVFNSPLMFGTNTNTYTFRRVPTEQAPYVTAWTHYYKYDTNGYICGWDYEDSCIKLNMYPTRPQY